ncbi:MAG: hypothetical protein UY85_C0001G0010 [Candidatus Peribacteria bacterium GW2011_GWB1_54_5]|nr:MAG: hypothetical protein UY85_C0001G0010 [Candidatus Peribacteria bacterium GW2011_GWB1_54_5]
MLGDMALMEYSSEHRILSIVICNVNNAHLFGLLQFRVPHGRLLQNEMI